MGEPLGEGTLHRVRRALRRLHAGEDAAELRAELREVLASLDATAIARLEQELAQEGFSRQELQRLCDVHLELFRDALDSQRLDVPAWHPLHILLEEHDRILNYAQALRAAAEAMSGSAEQASGAYQQAQKAADHLLAAENHLVREENVVFPQLERQGITEPPAVMWMEHDQLRQIKCAIRELLAERPEGPQVRMLLEQATALADAYATHIYKENNILYPTALRVIPQEAWPGIRAEFDGLGYCCFTPQPPPAPAPVERQPAPADDTVPLGVGRFTLTELSALLNTLPVDITFVDAQDTVRYFNETTDRIFVRTPSVIGRRVQQCHPEKSVHVVERIVEEFRNGTRDVAEFWLPLNGKLVYIRYFPVRNADGAYLGTLEVTQDVAHLKEIEGEKRLLDEPGKED